MSTLITILIIVAIVVVLIYNSLIAKKNQVDNVYAGIDAILTKRNDLIPNLIATAKAYMKHEKDLLEKITELRSQIMSSSTSPDQKIGLDSQLSGLLGNLKVAIEAYPDLKANENMMHLQRSLAEVEEQISAARRAYNQAVTDLNNAIEMFPMNLVASRMNLEKRKVYAATETERQNVNAADLFNR